MADEDLIFHMEYLDNATLTKPGCGNCHEVDSDEEENYYICPITDDPVLSKAAGDKVHNYYSNLVKNECYSSSSSPRNSFQVRVSFSLFRIIIIIFFSNELSCLLWLHVTNSANKHNLDIFLR